MATWLRRHPVLGGFILMFACTWPIDLWAAADSHGWTSVQIPPVLQLLVGYGFVVAALIATGVVDGRAGIRTLLRRNEASRAEGSGTPQGGVIARGDLVLDETKHTCTWKGKPVQLTVTEFLLVKALAVRPGMVKNRDQLIDAAYGENIYVDDRTIDSHVKRVRKKFRVADDGFGQIETLYGIGYRYKEA